MKSLRFHSLLHLRFLYTDRSISKRSDYQSLIKEHNRSTAISNPKCQLEYVFPKEVMETGHLKDILQDVVLAYLTLLGRQGTSGVLLSSSPVEHCLYACFAYSQSPIHTPRSMSLDQTMSNVHMKGPNHCSPLRKTKVGRYVDNRIIPPSLLAHLVNCLSL